jgi:hypothetical protein
MLLFFKLASEDGVSLINAQSGLMTPEKNY